MRQHHDYAISILDLINRIETMDAAGIDPDFDNEYQELEWEFACRRLHSSNQ